jgi:uncharacterized protein (TIGR02679 family)
VTGILERRELTRLWDALAERLQRNGLQPAGTIVLTGLDRDERHALAGLLGRPVPGDRALVDLAVLDRRLRASRSASGLVAAVEARCGPLVDRPAERLARLDARHGVWRSARAALDDAGLAAAPWVEGWLEDLRRSGVLGRLPPARATAALTTAIAVISRLPLGVEPPCGRGDLASLLTGDAHALDDGSVLAALVLRAAAAITERPYPSRPAGRRELWRAVGVLTDEVSTTALTIGLRSRHGGTWLDDRSDAGWETHLDGRDLRRIELRSPEEVFVCENPRVLEAALEKDSCRAVVCTQGQPAVVVLRLLAMLTEAGATLRYHGDFDWPGLTIANTLINGHTCTPWRFEAPDYERALGRLASIVGELPMLADRAVVATWDPALTATMARAGRTLHEELVLDELLTDLVGP